MKWWILWSLVSFVSHDMVSQNCVSGQPICKKCGNICQKDITSCCLEYVCKSSDWLTISAIKNLETILEETPVQGFTAIPPVCNLVVLLHKPNRPFRGIEIYASENQATLNPLNRSVVSVQLPSELDAGPENKIIFFMIQPNGSIFGPSYELYDTRLIGLSVRAKSISGLQERINITMKVTKDVKASQNLSCQFFNFSSENFSQDGCQTLWKHGQSEVTCSCDHLTYFAILVVPASIGPAPLSFKDQKILSYITQIGCSLSLFTLVITVVLFIANRALREDVSMKVHINLGIALILLNLHFLPSEAAAAWSSEWLCFYMALLLHYSLLATFSWMALEGFHLYLLFIKVFNIYIRKYLLKLSVVGWGVPGVIVSVVLIIDRDFYGRVPLYMANSNDTAICYITDDKVTMLTTLGLFSLVFLFNVAIFGVMFRRVLILHRIREVQLGQSNHDRTRKDICTVLGLIILLGITWGLVFFSFGHLTTPGLYLFCILNSVQGFFIFMWFVMSLRKAKSSLAKINNTTTSNSR